MGGGNSPKARDTWIQFSIHSPALIDAINQIKVQCFNVQKKSKKSRKLLQNCLGSRSLSQLEFTTTYGMSSSLTTLTETFDAGGAGLSVSALTPKGYNLCILLTSPSTKLSFAFFRLRLDTNRKTYVVTRNSLCRLLKFSKEMILSCCHRVSDNVRENCAFLLFLAASRLFFFQLKAGIRIIARDLNRIPSKT